MAEKRKRRTKVSDVAAEEIKTQLGLSNAAVTLIKKADPKPEVAEAMQSNAFVSDDEFGSLSEEETKLLIGAPFNLRYLSHLCTHNNALAQAIAAMEINIDGTGFDIEPKDMEEETEADDKEIKKIAAFFEEPWPRKSFTSIRRQLRRDLESTGNAYVEIIRNVNGDMMLANNIDPTMIRLVRLDKPTPVEVTLQRGEEEVTVTMGVRERRYAQALPTATLPAVAGAGRYASKLVFFKDYKSSRELNKFTGKWAEKGEVIPFSERASELIHFTVTKYPGSPYGQPRWINQLPSILGSRQAEELNLDFFNAGGLPPALIIVQGGVMAQQVKEQLSSYLSGHGANKHRAAIIEVEGSGGSLDGKTPTVRVAVERFGAEKQKDSMFENYDDKSEKRVRASFRLPPLFIGRTDDFNFASAKTAYMVAEAQVFKPERDEFDEIMNVTLMRELDPEGIHEYRSKPVTLKDVETQLKALELADNASAVTGGELIDKLNEVADLGMVVAEEAADSVRSTPAPFGMDDGENIGNDNGNPDDQKNNLNGKKPPKGRNVNGKNGGKNGQQQKIYKALTVDLINTAKHWAGIMLGTIDAKPGELESLTQAIKSLPPEIKDTFDHLASIHLLSASRYDPEGCTEISSLAAEIIGGEGCSHNG